MSQRFQVLEYSAPHIEDGIIKGVKIVGMKSENGRTYPRQVLRKAMSLYEGAPVYIAHPDPREKRQGSRQLVDHFGSLKNVHERHGSKATFGLFGDLHIKPSHVMASPVIKAIEDGTATFGLSHNVFVDMNEDKSQVLEIVEVSSVDLVDNPATTTNLFEEEHMDLKTLAAAGDDEFRTQVTEEMTALNTVLEAVQEELKEFRGLREEMAEFRKELATKKKTRFTALENKTDEQIKEETGEKPIGDSHEDFVQAMKV